jgi:hypothetical protein
MSGTQLKNDLNKVSKFQRVSDQIGGLRTEEFVRDQIVNLEVFFKLRGLKA